MITPQTLARIRSAIAAIPDEPSDAGRRYARHPPGGPEQPKRPPSREQVRQSVRTVDPSTVFGCVDWFLYPGVEGERFGS